MKLVASGSPEEIGKIEGIVENNADKTQFVLIERSGFLGFGAKQIAVPLEKLVVDTRVEPAHANHFSSLRCAEIRCKNFRESSPALKEASS